MNKITAARAAGILEVTAATVKNWQRTGRLPELTLEAVEELRSHRSRRNKSQIRECQVCGRYISGHGRLKELVARGVEPGTVPSLLAEAALRQLSPGTGRLRAFLRGELSAGEGDRLIRDLLDGAEPIPCAMLDTEWEADPLADVLGFIYASTLPFNNRRKTGIFYTPSAHAALAVSRVGLRGRVLDPCCGSGSFLLAAADRMDGVEELYGADVDPTAVKLARLNLYLRRPEAGVEYLYKNITVRDFLTETEKYDVMIGNPPWGGRPEMSVPFVLKALELLNEGGRFSFILPSALLTTRAHAGMREALLGGAGLLSADFLDGGAYGVCCPAVILAARAGGRGIEGCRVNDIFTIGRRTPDPRCLNLNVTDEEWDCLEKMRGLKNAVFLKDNAVFALGIVTGGNSRLISGDGGEPLIRGTDISPFHIKEPTAFLACDPACCQQAAPTEVYRAPEKLVYRFVGERPVFAVDRGGRLTLNSCNIIIPHIPGLDIDYLAAVMNSSAVGFFLQKSFAARKWLRWMLEEVPVPLPSLERQREIVKSPDWDGEIGALYGLNGAVKFYPGRGVKST